MRKLLLTLSLILAFGVGSFAQPLKQSTATTVRVLLANASTGAAITGITITNLSVRHVAHSDTTGATTEVEACQAAGTGDHDCTEIGNGVYEVEVAADKLGTLGRQDLCPVYTTVQAVPYCRTLTVISAASYDLLVTTGASSIDSFWEYQTSSIGTAGGIGLYIVTNSDSPTSTIAADVARQYVAKAGATTAFILGPFRNSAGTVIATGTPACTIRTNSSSTYSSTTNAPAAVDVNGHTLWSVDTAETSGKTAAAVVCTLTNAEALHLNIKLQ